MGKILCAVRDGKFVEPCDALASATEYGHPRGKQKGIFAYAWSNPAGPTRTVFGAKSGDQVARGLIFNFCPYCGVRIDGPIAES
jgi:hypothetical protein